MNHIPPFGPARSSVTDESTARHDSSARAGFTANAESSSSSNPAGTPIPDVILKPDEAALPTCPLQDRRHGPRQEAR